MASQALAVKTGNKSLGDTSNPASRSLPDGDLGVQALLFITVCR